MFKLTIIPIAIFFNKQFIVKVFLKEYVQTVGVLASTTGPSKSDARSYSEVLQWYTMYTAKTQYRKFETNIPRKGNAGLRPNFHIPHVSVSYLYIPRIGLPILLQENTWTESGNI